MLFPGDGALFTLARYQLPCTLDAKSHNVCPPANQESEEVALLYMEGASFVPGPSRRCSVIGRRHPECQTDSLVWYFSWGRNAVVEKALVGFGSDYTVPTYVTRNEAV